TRVPLCAGAPTSPAPGGFAYGAAPDLPASWLVSSRTPLAPDVAKLAHPLAAPPPLDAPARERLVRLVRVAMDDLAKPLALRDLPLTEIAVDEPGPAMAVIYSG